MNKPLVTVITVCYNAIETIEKTIISVISQSYSNIEYIIVDGASNDGTVDVIEKYEDKITVFISEPDKGVYDAMNKGLSLSNGKWVNFMNSGDCFVDENVIENLFKNTISDDILVLYGDVVRFFSNCGEVLERFNSLIDSEIPYGINHQSTFIDGGVMRELGYNTKYKLAADADFFHKVYMLNGKFQYVPIPIAVYEAESGLSSKQIIKCYDEYAEIKQLRKFSKRWIVGYLKILFQVCLMKILPQGVYSKLLYMYVRKCVVSK